MKKINLFKNLFYKKSEADTVEEIFSDEKVPAAKAYMVSKYGMVITKEELIKEFFDRARYTIQLKSRRHQFSAILEVDDDIKDYLPQIIEHYRTYGYNVIVIDENTNINNSYNEKASRITMTLIVITWDDPIDAQKNTTNTHERILQLDSDSSDSTRK